MPTVLDEDVAAGIDAVLQLKVTGAEPGEWHLIIKDKNCTVHKGIHSKPTLTITTPSEVWLKIARDELSGVSALMTGKFTAKGDTALLLKLPALFSRTLK